MSDMTDERAAEVLAAMRQDGGTVDDADWIASIDHAVSRLRSQPPAEAQRAYDGGFTAADMMDARQEGRKEAQQPAAVDGVDWRAMYRLQTAMRYMDNNAQLTKERAYRMADNDIAGLELQQGGRSDD